MAIYAAIDYNRLRADLSFTSVTLPDADAEAVLVQAASLYSAGAVYAGARVILLSQLLASSARLSSYRQNNTTENLSDVFKNLMALLAYWQGLLDKALLADVESVASASAQSVRVPVVAAW